MKKRDFFWGGRRFFVSTGDFPRFFGGKSPGGDTMAGKIKEALKAILNCFESGDIPEAIVYSMFPVPDLPSSK